MSSLSVRDWKEIRALQWTKPFWLQAFAYLLDKTVPPGLSPQLARFQHHLKHFELSGNDVIFRDQSRMYRVIREDQVANVLNQAWSDPKSNAYRGVHSFYDRLARETIGISKAKVREFLRNQETQQLDLRSQPALKVVKPLRPTHPFQWWQINLIDMSTLAHFTGKATFVLSVIDIFSKFLYSRPLKKKESKLVADALQDIFLSDGAPTILQSDNGPEFVNADMDELAKRWKIQLRHGLPYKPSTQGAVERVNQTLKHSIYKYLHQHETKTYTDVLPFLVYSYNTTRHSTTKHTPFEIHRGRSDVGLSVLQPTASAETDEIAEQMDEEKEKTAETKEAKEGKHGRRKEKIRAREKNRKQTTNWPRIGRYRRKRVRRRRREY